MILNYKKREDLLKEYGLKRPDTFLVQDEFRAVEVAEEMGYPVVAKISSDKHLHRTELGGVFVGISNSNELKEKFKKLSRIKEVEGVIIQKQICGVEMIIGAKNDSVFGPVVMFGTGGIMVEIFEDVTFRVAPFDSAEAEKMMEEVKGKRLLEGFRGKPEVDKRELSKLLSATSRLAHEKEIKELDFNPVIASEKGIYICDVKIVL